MTAITMFTIDTLTFVKKLEKSGMKKEIAETLAEEFKDAQIKSSEILATKTDISSLRNELKSEIKIAMLTTIISLGAIMAFIEKFIN